jgi:hypothetical protein
VSTLNTHGINSSSYYGYLIDILKRYNIPSSMIKPILLDPTYIEVPQNPIKWKPLLALAVLFFGLYLLSTSKSR